METTFQRDWTPTLSDKFDCYQCNRGCEMWHLHESIDVIKCDWTCLLNCQCKNKKDISFLRDSKVFILCK